MADDTRTIAALRALALRLWCDDGPDDERTLGSIDSWARRIPEDEAAALNGMLGEKFGGIVPWNGDHPVSVALRERATIEA